MPLNPDAVGTETEAREARWTSKDSLLYALGVGAGASDPTGFELEFTTENSDGITQKALPTMAVVIAPSGAGIGRGPMDAIGTFDMAMLVHGEQSITLHQPVPVEGTAMIKGRVAAMYDKGKAGGGRARERGRRCDRRTVVDQPEFGVHPRRRWMGRRPRPERPAQRAAGSRPRSRRVVHDPHRPGPALPPERRPEPAALRPEVRRARRVPEADPPRPLHVRVHGPGALARGVRQRPDAVQGDSRPASRTRSCRATRST